LQLQTMSTHFTALHAPQIQAAYSPKNGRSAA
jgi:hypothetical protein